MAKHKRPHKKQVMHKAPKVETAETIRTALSTNDFSQLNYYQKNLIDPNHVQYSYKLEYVMLTTIHLRS